MMFDNVAYDKHVYNLLLKELDRQMSNAVLIASENYVSPAVLQALGSWFTNKYSEGYPHKRYYAGNAVVDELEELVQRRAQQLFDAQHVNVQPYSGSPANYAVLNAFLNLGDTFMAMDLKSGGHLTHGSPVSFTGKHFKPVFYGVDGKGFIDYDQAERLALQHKPKLIIIGATSYPRIYDFKRMYEICERVGAICMADISHIAGLVVGGVHPNPVPYYDVVTTTTHKTLRGPRGAMIMCKREHVKVVDKAVFPGLQGGPHNHVTAAIGVALYEAMQPQFRHYAQQIVNNAKAMADVFMSEGLCVVSGGTDNHLILIDVRSVGLRGEEAQNRLERANIVVNKNVIPYDPHPPTNPSGIRLGTPAITTLGMRESEARALAELVVKVLTRSSPERVQPYVRELITPFAERLKQQYLSVLG